MLKQVSEGLLAGLGAVLLTREKIEEATHKLVAEAKLSRTEATKLNQELVQRGESQWLAFEQAVQERLQNSRGKLGLARQEEVDGLRQRVEALEARLALLEDRLHPATPTPAKGSTCQC